jgi:hypothetical protein
MKIPAECLTPSRIFVLLLILVSVAGCASSQSRQGTCIQVDSSTRSGGACIAYLPELHEAVHQGRIDLARARLDAGDNINARHQPGKGEQPYFYPPLYWAIKTGNLEMVRFLRSRGATEIYYPRSEPAGLALDAIRASCTGRPFISTGYAPIELDKRYVEDSSRIEIVEEFMARLDNVVETLSKADIGTCLDSGKFLLAKHLISRGARIEALGNVDWFKRGALLYRSALFRAYFMEDKVEKKRLLAIGEKCNLKDLVDAVRWVAPHASLNIYKTGDSLAARKYISDCINRGYKLEPTPLEPRIPFMLFSTSISALLPELTQMLLETGTVTANEVLDDKRSTPLHVLANVRDGAQFLDVMRKKPECWDAFGHPLFGRGNLGLFWSRSDLLWQDEAKRVRDILIKHGANSSLTQIDGTSASTLEQRSNQALADFLCPK